MPDLQDILRKLDEAIRAAIPELQFAVNRKRAYYGLSDYGWIIELAAYDVSVNVVFLGGADFSNPPPLGTTDRTRYVKVTTETQAQEPNLTRMDRASGSHSRMEVSRGGYIGRAKAPLGSVLRSVDNREILAPGSDGDRILLGHRLDDLTDVIQIVYDPGGQ